MLERSKRMTRTEHREASHIEDDGGIREIIQSADILPVTERERQGYGQMAALEDPQQLWSRQNWRQFLNSNPNNQASSTKKRKLEHEEDNHQEAVSNEVDSSERKVRRKLAFIDCSTASSNRK